MFRRCDVKYQITVYFTDTNERIRYEADNYEFWFDAVYIVEYGGVKDVYPWHRIHRIEVRENAV